MNNDKCVFLRTRGNAEDKQFSCEYHETSIDIVSNCDGCLECMTIGKARKLTNREVNILMTVNINRPPEVDIEMLKESVKNVIDNYIGERKYR